MSFDYHYTCPAINESIAVTKDTIHDKLDDLLSESNPLLEAGNVKERFIKEHVNYLYEALEHLFEGVRSTNEDMRKAAESQIDDLEFELSESKELVSNLEFKVSELESQVEKLEDKVCDLESEKNLVVS
jgi:chromosome segregation ATPase